MGTTEKLKIIEHLKSNTDEFTTELESFDDFRDPCDPNYYAFVIDSKRWNVGSIQPGNSIRMYPEGQYMSSRSFYVGPKGVVGEYEQDERVCAFGSFFGSQLARINQILV